MPLTAYVVDDERLAVERLTRMLDATARVVVAGSTTDPHEALSYLSQHDVDVLFVDIQMPGLTGFDLIERLNRDGPVVFTTAYDRYAIDAFTVNSIDYLLKPIDAERLARTLDKLDRLARGAHRDVRGLARELASQLSARPRRLDRIASRLGEKTTLLELARITHFVARDKATFAVAGGHEHPIDRTLAALESELDAGRFVRIHRSMIVNLAWVHELDAWIDGGVLVRLRDEPKTELPVARDRVRELKAKLGI